MCSFRVFIPEVTYKLCWWWKESRRSGCDFTLVSLSDYLIFTYQAKKLDGFALNMVPTFVVPSRWILMTGDPLTFSTTMRFTFVVLSEMSWHLLHGLSWYLVQAFMVPSDWSIINFVIFSVIFLTFYQKFLLWSIRAKLITFPSATAVLCVVS